MSTRTIIFTLVLALCGCGGRESSDTQEDAVKEGDPQKDVSIAGRAAQFGVGTFTVERAGQVVAALSVDEWQAHEVWVFDTAWPNGVQGTTQLIYTHRNRTFYADPKALATWVKGKYINQIAPMGLVHVASDATLPPAAPKSNEPRAGTGTFRVLVSGSVGAWVSIQSNRSELWILHQTWKDVEDTATLKYEEAIVDQAFTDFAAFRHWVETNKAQSGYGSGALRGRDHRASSASTQ